MISFVRLGAVALAFAAAALPARASAACTDAAHHQMDFFVGEWVASEKGQVVGNDSVIKTMDGCAVFEYWRNVDGRGKGFGSFGFQPGARSWHHSWVDDHGSTINFDGAPTVNAALAVTGVDFPKSGKRIHRAWWYVRGDGTVEEVWDRSSDGGKTWQHVFDGIFRRVSGAPKPPKLRTRLR